MLRIDDLLVYNNIIKVLFCLLPTQYKNKTLYYY